MIFLNRHLFTAKTPNEARATPGLKMLTPLERKMITKEKAKDRQRWEHLFSLNKWRLIK